MANDELHVLGNLHVVDWTVNRDIRQRLRLTPVKAENSKASHAYPLRLVQAPDDVRRVPGTGKHDQHISRARFDGKLSREDRLIAFVVGQTGQH